MYMSEDFPPSLMYAVHVSAHTSSAAPAGVYGECINFTLTRTHRHTGDDPEHPLDSFTKIRQGVHLGLLAEIFSLIKHTHHVE